MNYLLSDGIYAEGVVSIPTSKSISNRALVISALCSQPTEIENIAACDDTDVLLQALLFKDTHIDVGMAGTAMRFLTALLACKEGVWHLRGAQRMHQRPMKSLVEALQSMGATIKYEDKVGFAPLCIEGHALCGGEVTIDASVSSQFISALMLIAPVCRDGMTLLLQGKVVSRSYIEMTAWMMRSFGAQVSIGDDVIEIASGGYRGSVFTVESDWSAASYWYAYVALKRCGWLQMNGLRLDSVQGDAVVAKLFGQLGVKSCENAQGVEIAWERMELPEHLDVDCSGWPDLVPTLAVVCCYLDVPFVFSGLETLPLKESDRIAALVSELGKCGYMLYYDDVAQLTWSGERKTVQNALRIHTYNDQ